jgi:hypothetical protein
MRSFVCVILLGLTVGGCRAGECGRLQSEIEKEIAKAPGACSAASDCACYPGGTKASGCGGIARKETADAIAKLTTQIQAKKCGGDVSCAAWMCVPACVSGKCASGSLSVTPAP